MNGCTNIYVLLSLFTVCIYYLHDKIFVKVHSNRLLNLNYVIVNKLFSLLRLTKNMK